MIWGWIVAAKGTPWSKLYAFLPEDPKTEKLSKLLKRPKSQTVGYLCMLWCWVTKYRPDGDLTGLSDLEVSTCAGAAKIHRRFCEAAAKVGFLDGEAGARKVHNWQRYMGSYKRAKIQEKYRSCNVTRASPVTIQLRNKNPLVTQRGEEIYERKEEHVTPRADDFSGRPEPSRHEVGRSGNSSSSSFLSISSIVADDDRLAALLAGPPSANADPPLEPEDPEPALLEQPELAPTEVRFDENAAVVDEEPITTLGGFKDWCGHNGLKPNMSSRTEALVRAMVARGPIPIADMRAALADARERVPAPNAGYLAKIVDGYRAEDEENAERKKRGIPPLQTRRQAREDSPKNAARHEEYVPPPELTDEERERSLEAMRDTIGSLWFMNNNGENE